jgi:hypothetical protein
MKDMLFSKSSGIDPVYVGVKPNFFKRAVIPKH